MSSFSIAHFNQSDFKTERAVMGDHNYIIYMRKFGGQLKRGEREREGGREGGDRKRWRDRVGLSSEIPNSLKCGIWFKSSVLALCYLGSF